MAKAPSTESEIGTTADAIQDRCSVGIPIANELRRFLISASRDRIWEYR